MGLHPKLYIYCILVTIFVLSTCIDYNYTLLKGMVMLKAQAKSFVMC
jgi:hypothetical protein